MIAEAGSVITQLAAIVFKTAWAKTKMRIIPMVVSRGESKIL